MELPEELQRRMLEARAEEETIKATEDRGEFAPVPDDDDELEQPEAEPAPVAEPEPEPEEPAGAEPEEEDDDPDPKKSAQVPYRRFAQKRDAARAAQAELAQLRAELDALKAAQQPKPETKEETPPDPDLDPWGSVRYQQRQLAQKVDEAATYVQQTKQQQQQAEAFRRDIQTMQAAEQEIKTEYSDYDDITSQHNDIVRAYLRRSYPQATPEQIEMQMAQENLQYCRQAAAQGLHPAEAFYEKAKGLLKEVTPRRSTNGAKEAAASAAAMRPPKSKSLARARGAAPQIADDMQALLQSSGKEQYDRYQSLKNDTPSRSNTGFY